MSDAQRHGQHEEQFDTEIDVRRIGWFLVWLSVGAVVTCVLMYFLYRDFRSREERADRPASPMVDRTVAHLPPEPRLQVNPEKDLQAYRAEQEALLGSYGWVDQPLGVVRIPIDRAIDLVASQHLPSRAQVPHAPRHRGEIPPASGAGAVEASAPAASHSAAAPEPADDAHSGGHE